DVVMPKPAAQIEGWMTPEKSTASKCYNSLREQWRAATESSSDKLSTVDITVNNTKINAFAK
ncbi:MAG TPA: hypothetical protein VI522_05935, partial [Gammaproteobacteria bacterium]|nr:hypothetical protein [Gammaproteobacteria bacterium]